MGLAVRVFLPEIKPAPSRALNATLYRFHRSPSTLGKAVKSGAVKADLSKRVTPHILRHSFAVYLRKHGYSIEQIRKLMGHKRDKTTQYHYLRSIEQDQRAFRLGSC